MPVVDESVERVLVVSKTHLDVGFTDLATVVRRRYLEKFFPRAMSAAAELRARGGVARLRWTTGSWILSEALDAADRAGRAAIEEAIGAGDLCWHALPFTLHTEYCDRSLLEHGLSISARLDERFGRTTRSAKVTDVPGHTRGLVSVLAEAGVDLLHVGVNPASAAPQVPMQFRWRDAAAVRPSGAPAPEISVMYQPGGYGAVQTVAGTATAVAVELTGDNLGPPGVDDVEALFAELAARFPGAAIEAASFDQVAEVMASVRDRLPVVTAEIGDSWIHGVGSDPSKTAAFRALCRERRQWLGDGRVAADDVVLRAASTRLLLVAEHTWGMDLKAHWPDEQHWSADDLAAVRGDAATRRFESSWGEQRRYLEEFVDELRDGGRADLADDAAAVLQAAVAPSSVPSSARSASPAGSGEWRVVGVGEVVGVGSFDLVLDESGAVVSCIGPDGIEHAGPGAPLGRFALQTFDAADFERWYATYNAATTPADEWWARWDNTKPGLGHTAARSALWSTRLAGARHDPVAGVLAVDLLLDVGSSDPVAPPTGLRVTVRPGERTGELVWELRWVEVTAARWPAAWWWSFAPVVASPGPWWIEKLREQVSPFEVVDGGGRWLHAADRVAHGGGAELRLVDSPLVAPGRRRLLEWDDADVEPTDLLGGWHVCVFANLWGTNFPMWTEGPGRVRVVSSFPSP